MENGETIFPKYKARIKLSSSLSPTAQKVIIFDNIQTGSLISLGQLCDDDCIGIFSRFHVKIMKDNKVIIEGRRTDNGLWSIPLAPSNPPSNIPPPANTAHQASAIIRQDTTKKDLAQYYAASLFNPRPSTMRFAIRNNFLTTWPGLTIKLLSKHLPHSEASAKGHMDQEQKNLQSTSSPTTDLHDEELSPLQVSDNIKTDDMLCSMEAMSSISKSYSDQTGKFPIKSSRGNEYLFILYHFDTNSIHAVAIKDRRGASIRDAWVSIFDTLKIHGEAPNLHILDNECSEDIKNPL